MALAAGWQIAYDASGKPVKFLKPGEKAPAGTTASPYSPDQGGLNALKAPAGYYDPGLDAQERATGRGLAQSLADLQSQGERAQTSQGWTLEDLLRGRDRGLADIGTSRTRANEDYGTSIANLDRNYARLGSTQTQNATAAGVEGGGALQASANQRAENQAIDRAPIDTGHTRTLADLLKSETQLGEDYNSGVERANTQYGWGVGDRATQGQRATDENTFFGQDVNGQRLFQAGQAGWTAPQLATPKPKAKPKPAVRIPIKKSAGGWGI
jgi:hypothetical protein